MQEFECDENKLYRATIRAMPRNPAGQRCGVRTGLWYVAIYKRRGMCVENEDFVRLADDNLEWDDALELSSALNKKFQGN